MRRRDSALSHTTIRTLMGGSPRAWRASSAAARKWPVSTHPLGVLSSVECHSQLLQPTEPALSEMLDQCLDHTITGIAQLQLLNLRVLEGAADRLYEHRARMPSLHAKPPQARGLAQQLEEGVGVRHTTATSQDQLGQGRCGQQQLPHAPAQLQELGHVPGGEGRQHVPVEELRREALEQGLVGVLGGDAQLVVVVRAAGGVVAVVCAEGKASQGGGRSRGRGGRGGRGGSGRRHESRRAVAGLGSSVDARWLLVVARPMVALVCLCLGWIGLE